MTVSQSRGDQPYFVAPTVVGVGTSVSGTGDVTPGLPAGHVLNDILVIHVHSSNQTATAPAGYAQMGPVLGYGTAAAAGAMRLTKFWKRDGGSETDPTVLDTGDHTLAQIIAYRGCPTSGDPFLFIGAKRKLTASTTGTGDKGATPIDNCLVCTDFVHNLDSASPVFSAPTNADLTSVTEQLDAATADGTGGGFGLITGTKAIAAGFAATTVTETSTQDLTSTYIMLPAGITSRAGFIDRQVFLTSVAGSSTFSDQWAKPTGAKWLSGIGIGGGASGSAGRNASVAAGGGGGGGGSRVENSWGAAQLPATLTVNIGRGGPATANSDGAASTAGGNSNLINADTGSGTTMLFCPGGFAAVASATGSGGAGGAGGGIGTGIGGGANPGSPPTVTPGGLQSSSGGTGGTTAAAGTNNADFGGGGGAGGGTSQATSVGGTSRLGGGGGGGGRSNTNFGTGGGSLISSGIGGATVGANGTDSVYPEYGGTGAAGGNSATGPGGTGGWPGGGGGGGGSQSGAQRGGAGGDGAVTITTFC